LFIFFQLDCFILDFYLHYFFNFCFLLTYDLPTRLLVLILVPTFLILFVMLSITFFHFMAIFLSILALFVMCFMASFFVTLNSDLYGIIGEVYADPMAWLTMILALMTPMALELLWRGLKRDLRPTLTEILQERIRKRKRNEIKIKKGNTEKKRRKRKTQRRG